MKANKKHKCIWPMYKIVVLLCDEPLQNVNA